MDEVKRCTLTALRSQAFLWTVKLLGFGTSLCFLFFLYNPAPIYGQVSPTIAQHDQLVTAVTVDEKRLDTLDVQIAKEQAGHEAVLEKLDELRAEIATMRGIGGGAITALTIMQGLGLLAIGQKRGAYRASDRRGDDVAR